MSGLHPEKVLVPIDFSDLSYDALDQSIGISDDVEVHMIHVLTPLHTMEPGNLYAGVSEKERVEAAVNLLDQRTKVENRSRLIAHAAVGDPGHEIAELAMRLGVDLIVIPSHGYGFVKRMLLGSVAERVVRLAHCPVLVLRN